MISSMREYFKSLKFILVIIVIAFVATSVVYFGTGDSGSGGTPNIVGTVNGEEIPTERFRRTQANLIEQYERMTRQRLTPEMIERLGLNQRVMNELVNDTMVVQAAGREGVRVSDDELRSRIQEMREFQQDGRFSRDRYLRILKQVRLEPGSFEAEMRRQLIRKKIEDLVKDGVKVSDAELQEAYSARNQRVRMAWASLDTTPLMAGVTVPDADLEPYVKAHQAQFTRPERRRIQYVIVSAPVAAPGRLRSGRPGLLRQATSKEYEQLPQVHAAHILVRVPPVGGSEAENKAKAKIEDVLKRARAGEDFAKLAKETSEDTANAQQGGDLGFVKRGDLVPQFEQAAFALKKGELAPAPVRTPFGYHAIKVLDVKDGGKTPFKDVVDAIKAKLAAKRAEEEASKKAEADQAKLLVGQGFRRRGAAPSASLCGTLSSGAASSSSASGAIPRSRRRSSPCPSAAPPRRSRCRPGMPSSRSCSSLPAGVPPLEEIKARVIEAIKRERAEVIAMDRAKALVAALGKGGDFLATAKADGFATGETPLFSRAEPPKEARLPGGVLLAAVQTPTGQVSEPVKTGTAVYVVKTLERQPADAAGFDKQREELAEADARAEAHAGLGRLGRVAEARVEDRPQPPRRDALANSEGGTSPP